MSLLLSVLLFASAANWDCQLCDRDLWYCHPRQPVAALAPIAVPAPIAVSAPIPAPMPAPVPAKAALDPYVVQVGAFRYPEEALRAQGLMAPAAITVTPIERDGIAWWVLLLGSYADFDSARAAGESWLQRGAEADYWIRDAVALSELMIPAGVDAPAR
jgi:hypothetical protein